MKAELIKDTDDVPERKHHWPNLRAWPKGMSGCPGGKRQNGKRYRALYEAQEAALIAHHGRRLSPREALLLDELVDLKLRKTKTIEDTTRRANSLDRLLRALYGTKPPAAAVVPLRERLAAEAAETEPAA
jgi:hypothetical protein